jgi:hypothetical protein
MRSLRRPVRRVAPWRIPLTEVAAAVVDVEAADHAIAVEGDVVAEARRKLWIGLHPEERAVELAGNCALVREIYNVRFDARGCVEARESGRLGKWAMAYPLVGGLCKLY